MRIYCLEGKLAWPSRLPFLESPRNQTNRNLYYTHIYTDTTHTRLTFLPEPIYIITSRDCLEAVPFADCHYLSTVTRSESDAHSIELTVQTYRVSFFLKTSLVWRRQVQPEVTDLITVHAYFSQQFVRITALQLCLSFSWTVKVNVGWKYTVYMLPKRGNNLLGATKERGQLPWCYQGERTTSLVQPRSLWCYWVSNIWQIAARALETCLVGFAGVSLSSF